MSHNFNEIKGYKNADFTAAVSYFHSGHFT